MAHSRKEFLALFVLLCGVACLAAERKTYTVIELGGLSDTKFANVADINDSGQIVGISAEHAFLWENGMMTDLGTLGGKRSAANAINNRGQVVGESDTASGEMHAFLWDHGVMSDLGTLGETSSAHGINSRGEIVGAIFRKNVRGSAVLWKKGGNQSLGDLAPSGSGSTSISINDNGEVAGVSSGFAPNAGGVVRAVVWQNGIAKDIGTLGGLHSTASALNNLGEVVGWAETSDQSTNAFLWHDGVMRNLGTLPDVVKSGSRSQAVAVNGHGQVVGSSLNSKGESRAVIWVDGKITDLNDLIPPAAGLALTRAEAINNRGQILAELQIHAESPTRSFLLTPQ